MTKSGTLGTKSKVECPKFQFLWFFFHELNQSEWFRAKKNRKISTDGHFWSLWAHGEKCIFWTGYFEDLKFSGILPRNIIYQFWEFQKHLGSKRFSKKILSVKMHIMGQRWKMSHFNRIFFGPEVFRDGSSHYYLPFLRVLAKSLA